MVLHMHGFNLESHRVLPLQPSKLFVFLDNCLCCTFQEFYQAVFRETLTSVKPDAEKPSYLILLIN